MEEKSTNVSSNWDGSRRVDSEEILFATLHTSELEYFE